MSLNDFCYSNQITKSLVFNFDININTANIGALKRIYSVNIAVKSLARARLGFSHVRCRIFA